MNGIEAIKCYVDRIVTADHKCRGGMMKVLLLDSFTTQIVSSVYSQSEVLGQEVYLVSRLDDPNHNPNLGGGDKVGKNEMSRTGPSSEDMENDPNDSKRPSHMKAICYLRPTETNAGLLLKELSSPRFSEYHIFFSGIVTSSLLRLLAENDGGEVIRQVQEFYGDYLPVNDDLLTFNCRDTIAMTRSAGTAWARDHVQLYERNRQGLESVLLSLKVQPRSIRYQASSVLAEQLARDVHEQIVSDQIFHFRSRRGNTVVDTGSSTTGGNNNGGCLLLVLDRVDDPVTPLLSQWTYQAMVHELLGLNNNRVILKGAPNVSPDLDEVVLSTSQDEFFRKNRNSNFGELGEAIQRLLKDYQTQTQTKNNLNTIEDMQQFMEKFPELKSQSHTVSKHVALMGEMARLVDVCNLMDVSQFEQELACADDHTSHYRELVEKLQSREVKIPDKLRLGLLYALRYETSGNVNKIKVEMRDGGVPDEMVDLVDVMLGYAGRKVRGPGLYGVGTKDIMSKMTKSFMTNVQGVSNVYSQHVPVLMDTIQAIMRGKLKVATHPYIIGKKGGSGGTEDIPSEIIVFMAGGVTYEEAAKVSEFNEANKGKIRVLLGGSTIHNSTSFLEELKGLS